MRCPKCGTENPEKSKYCQRCGTPMPTLPNKYRKVSYRDEYYRAQYNAQGRNNTLLFTIVLAVATVVLGICAFFVLKYTVLDQLWKEPAPSSEIALSEDTGPSAPQSEKETGAKQTEASGQIQPYSPSTPAKSESIIHSSQGTGVNAGGAEQNEPGQGEQKEEPAEKREEQKEEEKQEEPTAHYIIPYSNTRYLTEDDLKGLTEWELKLARNEIYARHGRRFKDPALQEYFDAQSWYSGRYDPEEFDKNHSDELSALEKWNAEFILKYEKDHGYMT